MMLLGPKKNHPRFVASLHASLARVDRRFRLRCMIARSRSSRRRSPRCGRRAVRRRGVRRARAPGRSTDDDPEPEYVAASPVGGAA
jgi:hypothetical protein